MMLLILFSITVFISTIHLSIHSFILSSLYLSLLSIHPFIHLSVHHSQQSRVSHGVKRPVSVTRKVPHDRSGDGGGDCDDDDDSVVDVGDE